MSEILNPDDVVSTESEVPLINRPTFQSGEFVDALGKRCGSSSPVFTEGIPCKLLRPGGGWRNGRVKISLEFIPDDNHQNQ